MPGFVFGSDGEVFELNKSTEILISMSPDIRAISLAKTSPNSKFNFTHSADEGSQYSHWDEILRMRSPFGVSTLVSCLLVSIVHQFLEANDFGFCVSKTFKFEKITLPQGATTSLIRPCRISQNNALVSCGESGLFERQHLIWRADNFVIELDDTRSNVVKS